MRLDRSKIVSGVIAAKIILLVGLWTAFDDGARIGDRSAVAAETGAEEVTKQADEPTSNANDTPETEADTAPKQERKSFLANLLDLPAFDTSDMKKEELGRYLELVERKKRQVEDRLDILGEREQQLQKLERVIDEKLRLLDEERKFFAQTIQKEKEVQADRLEKLISLYAKMEPKKAAPVMEELDKDLVVSLFKAIPQKQITAILEQMNPEKSVELSEYYGRLRSAREYDLLKEMNRSLRQEFDDCKGMP